MGRCDEPRDRGKLPLREIAGDAAPRLSDVGPMIDGGAGALKLGYELRHAALPFRPGDGGDDARGPRRKPLLHRPPRRLVVPWAQCGAQFAEDPVTRRHRRSFH